MESILQKADLVINGAAPHDPQINDQTVYNRILREGYMGLGESFMDKQWDVDRLDQMFMRMQQGGSSWKFYLFAGLATSFIKNKLFNRQVGEAAYTVGQEHYDLGNDLYQAVLDKRMVYTCAYWKDAKNLNDAQEAKLDLICKKLGLKPGDTVLDVGCGWGSFMKYAAENYGAVCTGLTVSVEQADWGKKSCAGLDVTFVIEDYQKYKPATQFDHVVSVEMIEAVGRKNFRTYMHLISTWLKPEGRFVLQSIGSTKWFPTANPWIDKYIFPNGMLPNRRQLNQASKGLLVSHDWHDIGPDYEPTLMAWWDNFDAAYKNLDQTKYDERFYRMWKFYLQSCAAGFATGFFYDWQIVYTKPSVTIDSDPIR